uniref:Uncharacterized protein n=1 Tax=Sphaerodactylus townsendi TaxID=933632 RepID=A0ACB8FG22_9SAUR
MDLKALDEFVNLPDPHYNYTILSRENSPFIAIGVNIDSIKVTSQKWLDESEVDKVVWSHTLKIAVPKFGSRKISISESCLLMITTDQKDEFISNDFFTLLALKHTAVGAKSVVAILSGALFQPLTFKNDPLRCKNITGYDIVACSWRRFINDSTAPAHVLVQFPIVKAVVRAMDTITDHVKKEYGQNVTKFTLAGLGLGGWISWLTAAVDKRVEAIAPVAMDFLNFTESFKHHYRAYCGWSYMMRPFYKMNITQELDNPHFQELASHLDPMEYNERYANVTKYIIVLSGDEFFPPDNSRFYFSQLEGKKYLL